MSYAKSLEIEKQKAIEHRKTAAAQIQIFRNNNAGRPLTEKDIKKAKIKAIGRKGR